MEICCSGSGPAFSLDLHGGGAGGHSRHHISGKIHIQEQAAATGHLSCKRKENFFTLVFLNDIFSSSAFNESCFRLQHSMMTENPLITNCLRLDWPLLDLWLQPGKLKYNPVSTNSSWIDQSSKYRLAVY